MPATTGRNEKVTSVIAVMLGSPNHMAPERPKVEPIRNSTLFQMEKLDKAADLTNQLNIERPTSYECSEHVFEIL
jgi:hypothetical protein